MPLPAKVSFIGSPIEASGQLFGLRLCGVIDPYYAGTQQQQKKVAACHAFGLMSQLETTLAQKYQPQSIGISWAIGSN
jgi:hypothetical protein